MYTVLNVHKLFFRLFLGFLYKSEYCTQLWSDFNKSSLCIAYRIHFSNVLYCLITVTDALICTTSLPLGDTLVNSRRLVSQSEAVGTGFSDSLLLVFSVLKKYTLSAFILPALILLICKNSVILIIRAGRKKGQNELGPVKKGR